MNPCFKAEIEVKIIINWEKIEQRIRDWIHKNPDDIFQIRNRAMIAAGSPVFIGFAIGLIIVAIIEIIEIGGRL